MFSVIINVSEYFVGLGLGKGGTMEAEILHRISAALEQRDLGSPRYIDTNIDI